MKETSDITSIYTLYVDDLFTYALYLGFKKETAMDAIHDVFAKIASDEKKLHDVQNIKFYLFKSLKNRLYDIYNSNKQHLNLPLADASGEMPFTINVTVEDAFIETEDREFIRTQIEEMLGSLTEKQREIIYLRYIQEYDYPQISELLNISVRGCRKLVSKAMQNLREKYGVAVLLFLLS